MPVTEPPGCFSNPFVKIRVIRGLKAPGFAGTTNDTNIIRRARRGFFRTPGRFPKKGSGDPMDPVRRGSRWSWRGKSQPYGKVAGTRIRVIDSPFASWPQMPNLPPRQPVGCRQFKFNSQHHMGDKSPKANQKKSSQKQAKSNSADQKKQQAAAAKAAGTKKK